MLNIKSLHSPRLELNAKRLRLNVGADIALELISYLIEHDASSLEQICAGVFPNLLPPKARRYFHTVRDEIRAATDGLLEIQYDSWKKIYHLHSSTAMSWDVQSLRNHLRLGELQRAFDLYAVLLPASNNSWVLEARDGLEDALSACSIEALRLIEGSDQHGPLLMQVLDHIPLNPAIHVYSIRYTLRTSGAPSTRRSGMPLDLLL